MSQSPRRAMRPAVDVIALLARIAVGVVVIAHGWQVLTQQMDASGGAMIILGGLLIVGLLLPFAGVLLAVQIVVAVVFGGLGDPPFTGEGGWALSLAIGAAALVLGFKGGRISVDRLLPWNREKSADANTDADTAADTDTASAGRTD